MPKIQKELIDAVCAFQEEFKVQFTEIQPYEYCGRQYLSLHELFPASIPYAVFMPLYSVIPQLFRPNEICHVGDLKLIYWEMLYLFIGFNQRLNQCDIKGKKSDVFTYLMFDDSTQYYKIGQSVRPKAREKTLQSEKPTIRIILLCNDNVEYELHRKFAKQRVRGEWFSLNADDVLALLEDYNFYTPAGNSLLLG